jgi:hypothetical protein
VHDSFIETTILVDILRDHTQAIPWVNRLPPQRRWVKVLWLTSLFPSLYRSSRAGGTHFMRRGEDNIFMEVSYPFPPEWLVARRSAVQRSLDRQRRMGQGGAPRGTLEAKGSGRAVLEG